MGIHVNLIRILILTKLFCLFYLDASALNKDSLHLYPITSVHSDDYSDLTFLDEFIKDKKIVFLGESAHGINDFHALKFRLIRYLYEFHGFDVVAFESGVSNIGYAEILKDSLSGMELLAHTLMGYWRIPVNCRMMTYIRDNDMHIAGLDPFTKAIFFKKEQYKKLGIEKKLAEKLFRLDSIYQFEYSIVKSRRYADFVKDGKAKDFSDLDSLAAYLIAGYTQAIKDLDVLENDKEKIILQGILSNIRILHNCNDVESNLYYDPNMMRDSSMAKNLEYLKDILYPNKKIIVLAHNGHIEKTSKNVVVKSRNQTYASNTIGDFLRPDIMDRSFIIGLFATGGTYTRGYNSPEEIELKRHSLEKAVKGFPSKAAFVLTSNLKNIKYKMLGINVYTYTKEVENLFDAVIFVNDVQGSRIIRRSDDFECD